MSDYHVANRVGGNAEIRQRVDRVERELARTRLRLFGIEAGIDQDVATGPSDQPDEIIQVLRRGLVRIGDQKIQMGGARRHRRIAQRVDFVGISHRCHFFLGCLDWPIPATSHCHPQRSNPGRRMTAARQCSALCETDHIAGQCRRQRRRQCLNMAAIEPTATAC